MQLISGYTYLKGGYVATTYMKLLKKIPINSDNCIKKHKKETNNQTKLLNFSCLPFQIQG